MTVGADCACDCVVANCMAVSVVVASKADTGRRFFMMVRFPRGIPES